MLSDIMLAVANKTIMPSVPMLNVIVLIVIMLIVVALKYLLTFWWVSS
jgi:hypothetical protein